MAVTAPGETTAGQQQIAEVETADAQTAQETADGKVIADWANAVKAVAGF
jgi:hypothetical protein